MMIMIMIRQDEDYYYYYYYYYSAPLVDQPQPTASAAGLTRVDHAGRSGPPVVHTSSLSQRHATGPIG